MNYCIKIGKIGAVPILIAILIFASSQKAFCLSESTSYEASITANTSGVITATTTLYDIQVVAGQPVIGVPAELEAL